MAYQVKGYRGGDAVPTLWNDHASRGTGTNPTLMIVDPRWASSVPKDDF
jgi:hypothetical protein